MNKFVQTLLRPLFIGIGLFVASLAVRLGAFALFPHPAYPDSFYYSAVAQSLASGHGFSISYLWNFIEVGSKVPAPAVLPIPSNAHWMPLASLIQVPFLLAFGLNEAAGAVPFILLGALLAPLSYAFARDMLRPELRRSEGPAIVVSVLAICGCDVIDYLSQPDNFALYAVLVVAVLWIIGRILRGDPGIVIGRRAFGESASLAVCGVLTGLAYLSRNDGVLLPVAIGAVWLIESLRARRAHVRPALSFRGLCLYGLVALAVVAPWLLRQELTFGSLSPSAAAGRILWIRTYSELFSADGPIGAGYLLSWGWQNLLISRLSAIVNVVVLLSFELLFILGPFWTLTGLRRNLLRPALRPYLIWAAAFLSWSVIVAAPHLLSGNFLHSSVALAPLLYLLLVDGLYGFAAAFSRFWIFKRFSAEGILHKTLFTALCVALIFSFGLSLITASVWSNYRAGYEPAITAINAHGGAGQVVMAADPGLLWSLDPEMPAIQTPTSDLDIIENALHAYGVHWLLIDRDSAVPALAPILHGTLHPAWLSAQPIYQSPLGDPEASGDNTKYPRITVYEVLPPIAPEGSAP